MICIKKWDCCKIHNIFCNRPIFQTYSSIGSSVTVSAAEALSSGVIWSDPSEVILIETYSLVSFLF